MFTSTPLSQQPNPGWLWYHPTTISGRPHWRSMSSMRVWKTGSTASTETPVPDCGAVGWAEVGAERRSV